MGIPGIRIKRCEQKIEFAALQVYEYALNCRESEKKRMPSSLHKWFCNFKSRK